MDQFWKYSGIIFWIIIGLSLIMPLLFGRYWWLKIGGRFFFGGGLINASNQLIEDFQKREFKREHIAEFTAHVIWRLTRVGLFAALITSIPLILLWQQNRLFNKQNGLFQFQNEKINQQTELLSEQTKLLKNQNRLFTDQNKNVEEQTELFQAQNILLTDQNRNVAIQTRLFGFQNTKIDSQLNLMGVQNERLDLQNNLIEAQRRGSLVILMSNVLDQMNQEINNQKQQRGLEGKPDTLPYRLSQPLVGRIAGLSQGFLPYRIFQGDTLTDREYSLERGQLLLTLVNSRLDLATMRSIYSSTIFEQSYLPNAKLGYADLIGANLSEADLRYADLFRADLIGANLSGAILFDAKGLTLDQLLNVQILYGVEGLNKDLQQELENIKPCLFKPEGCE